MSLEVTVSYNGVSVTDAYVTIKQVRESKDSMIAIMSYYKSSTEYAADTPFRPERAIMGLPVDYTGGTDSEGKNTRKQAYEWLLSNEAEFSGATEV